MLLQDPEGTEGTLQAVGSYGIPEDQAYLSALIRLNVQAEALARMALRFGMVDLVWEHEEQQLGPTENLIKRTQDTLFCCALRTPDQGIGLIYASCREKRKPTTQQIVAAAQVAQSLSLGLHRQHLKGTVVNRARHLQSVIDQSPDIILVGQNMKILSVNPAFTRILGYLPEEVIGRPVTDFSHPEDTPTASSAHLDIVESGQPSPAHRVRWMHRAGHAVLLEWTFTPLEDRRGIAVGREVPRENLSGPLT
ncbi:PAS domain S-box protein [Deinococcus cellulosilyticus]|uniref:PAS domain-containing protein n=1 Tax=Deinococcus cellulosilyticus (strain DSM 18568 / NBRC 106333 / KACC 11606 / 5516J-15) TaxID=1223518 RepID=A0A511N671_DEIC1|nr:PAS domain-containing protein [Deinococcus cellulosilyticus]GEM48343.1 hypothetical protein DC3_39780 [Deinococcus cellulosilyticus NBRC 106333 = KACC 11606]